MHDIPMFAARSRIEWAHSISEIETKLGTLRRKRGVSAIQLAAIVGVSRQTVYAIEAGTYVPNTAVSLRLARALDTTVEEIFQLEPKEEARAETAEATVLGDLESMRAGQPLRLCVSDTSSRCLRRHRSG